jgi:sorbitol-specific phosphotransferase system component IIBC
MGEEKKYRAVKIEAGKRGWGGPLVIKPKPGRELIYSVTGGGIHPLAQKIADMTGGTPFDGFRSKADFDEIAVAVIDCGGTARVGVYPMKKVPTVDIYPTSPSGPLMRFITEDLFVSGVKEENLSYVDEEEE